MALLRDTFMRTLASENSSHPMLHRYSMGGLFPTAEDDTEAAALMQDAQGDLEAADAQTAVADESTAMADKAEDAGEAFMAAADTVEAGGDVSEAAVAQADALASDVATAVGADVAEMVPSIPEEDREAIVPNVNPVAGESAAFKFKAGYSSSRRDVRALRMAGESMFDSAKTFGKNAMASIMKAYDHICQYIGKYFGTYQRALKRFNDIKERASKDLSGRKKDSTKLPELTGTDVITLTKWKSATDDTPVYLTKSKEISEMAVDYKKIISAMVDAERSSGDAVKDFSSTITGIDVSNVQDAVTAFFETLNKYKKIAGSVSGGTAITEPAFIKEYANLDIGEKDPHKQQVYSVSSIAIIAGYTNLASVEIAANFSGINEDQLTWLQKSGSFLWKGNKGGKKTLKTSLEVDAFTGGEIEDIAMNFINVIEDLVAYRNSKGFLKNKETLRKLEAADKVAEKRVADQLGKTENKTKNNDKLNKIRAKGTLEISKRLLRDFTALRDLFLNFDKFMFLIEKICNRSLGNYVKND